VSRHCLRRGRRRWHGRRAPTRTDRDWISGVGITAVRLLAAVLVLINLSHRRKPSATREEGAMR